MDELIVLKTLNIKYYGKNVLLGSSIGKTSMERGYFYSERNNLLFPLLDDAFYPEERVFTNLRDGFIDCPTNRGSTGKELTEEINKFNLSLEDVIHHCYNETNSKDTGIKRSNIILYNPKLYEFLTDFETTILVNGKSVLKFIKWYLCDVLNFTANQAYRFVNQKIEEGKIIVLLSSSGANNGKAKERKEQWVKVLRKLCLKQ